MKFGQLELDPAINPAVLDTGTWDPQAAWRAVAAGDQQWNKVQQAALHGRPLPAVAQAVPHGGSCVTRGSACCMLVSLGDGQDVLVELGRIGGNLGAPIGTTTNAAGLPISAYPASAVTLGKFLRVLQPISAPRALGTVPRLGIGTRMTTAIWPGIFAAMDQKGFAANTVQNSVRELNFMEDLLACRPAPTNYACGFGTIETGYTGSSWEGLMVAGILAALKHPRPLRWGADADHVQVKRGAEGMARARRILDAARHYTFYTLDMADVLDYSAAGNWPAKYDKALRALEELTAHIESMRDGRAFDLELSIDEHPPEVGAFDCLTTAAELRYVLEEIRRRGLPVTHVAPNFGQEKGWDYRCPDGLDGLQKRVAEQFAIAEDFGVLLDIHSADDLGPGPRQAIRRATGGKVHYKVSPMLQLIYADAVTEHAPQLFQQWWDSTLAYARREAQAGSTFAIQCLQALDDASDKRPSRRHMVFHHYSFAFVGRRDADGRFLYRQMFYQLPQAFRDDVRRRISEFLCGLANDLF
jgi:hypothetical protein